MGTCKVHNVRFYDLEPRAINCMAYDKKRRKLALSRADNSVEVWDTKFTPHIELTIPGHPEASVESLVWCNDRLFGAGLQGLVNEFDLITLSIKSSLPVTAGACWCIDIAKNSTRMAAGTEEGYINILNLSENSLVLEKILDKQEGRILSLAWDPSGMFIASGSIGAVRVWSVETGHALHRMTTGKETNFQDTLVWCVAFTKDFTVISGDSRGKLTFWDGKLGCCIKSYQSHKADILTLCLSEDNKAVYCAGVDPLITNFEKIKIHSGLKEKEGVLGGKGDKVTTWVRSFQRRLHDHDVRSLVAGERNQLFSAGVDGYLGISCYPPKMLSKYPPVPQGKCVILAPKVRCVLFRFSAHLELWRLGATSNIPEGDETSKSGNMMSSTGHPLPLIDTPCKEVELLSKDGQPIMECAISDDARWIAFSTPYNFRIFNLLLEGGSADISMEEEAREVKKNTPLLIKVTGLLPEVGHNPTGPIAFTSISGQMLCLASSLDPSPKINIIGLVYHDPAADAAAPPAATLLHTIDLKVHGGLTGNVHLMSISQDGKYLGVADINGNIAVWNSENWKIDSTLPKYNCKPTAMGIHPETNDLVAVYADHQIIEWSNKSKKYTKFCRKLMQQGLPKKWISRSFPVLGISFDAKKPDIIILHDDSTIAIIDKSKDLPKKEAKIPRIDPLLPSSPENSQSSCQPRISADESSTHAFHFLKKYKHLVHLGWIDDGELVAVEVSPTSLIEKLPPSLKQKRFGR